MAKDKIHDAVLNALVKDGWSITADPFTIVFEELRVFADLTAERLLSARQGKREIAIEIKSFLGPSPVHDLEVALGQYVLYRCLLRATASQCELYLDVSQDAHDKVFRQVAVEYVVAQEHLRLVVIDVEDEVVVSWRN